MKIGHNLNTPNPPILRYWPKATSRKNMGIPANISVRRYGMRNAPANRKNVEPVKISVSRKRRLLKTFRYFCISAHSQDQRYTLQGNAKSAHQEKWLYLLHSIALKEALSSKFSRFHAVFGYFGKIVCWHPHPGGLAPTPAGNPGSAPGHSD